MPFALSGHPWEWYREWRWVSGGCQLCHSVASWITLGVHESPTVCWAWRMIQGLGLGGLFLFCHLLLILILLEFPIIPVTCYLLFSINSHKTEENRRKLIESSIDYTAASKMPPWSHPENHPAILRMNCMLCLVGHHGAMCMRINTHTHYSRLFLGFSAAYYSQNYSGIICPGLPGTHVYLPKKF